MINIQIDDIWVKIFGLILSALGTVIIWMFKNIHKDVAKMKLDLAVVKSHMGTAIKSITALSKNNEELIRLDERQKKLIQDINQLHTAKREIISRLAKINHNS